MVIQYPPRPELSHFISKISLIRYEFDRSRLGPTNPFPPQPEQCLYFYPYDRVRCRNYANQTLEELPHSILVGPQLHRVDLTMGHNMLVIIVWFLPGAMHRLLRVPMDEMLGRPIDSTLLLGKEIDLVSEQLNNTIDFTVMIKIVESYLLKKAKGLKGTLPVEQVLASIIQNKSTPDVDSLARQACVSNRQLERQFKERTGMPPKVFLRLIRFSKAWLIREKDSDISWMKIAHACDYADQMHMVRDFKDFAGVTPGILQSDLERSSLRLQGTTID